METDYNQQDEWYIREAVAQFRALGWVGKIYGSRLLHPEGRERFTVCGAVVIYGYPNEEHFLVYMITLFPYQYLPLHHHEDCRSVLKVVSGSVAISGMIGSGGGIMAHQGEFLIPRIGEKYGYNAYQGGALLIGVCHKNHTEDYHWESLRRDVFTTLYHKEEPTSFDLLVSDVYGKYRETNSTKLNSDAIQRARKELDILIPLYKNFKKPVTSAVVARAALAGRLDFLQWVLASYGGAVFNYELSVEFAKRGDSKEVEQWLKNRFASCS